MSDRHEESSEPRRDETQDDYDRAAWDYLNWLNDMSQEEREIKFQQDRTVDLQIERIKRQKAVRCPTCGEFALEMRYSREHTVWQCLEATCRERWEWRAK